MNDDRPFVPLADVAAACGLSAYKLQTALLPAHWATPRDFKLLPPRYTCLIAEASLPELVAHLEQEGFPAAAARLDAWRTEIVTPESHEQFAARHGAGRREQPWFKSGQYA